jgi:hypothetical protein
MQSECGAARAAGGIRARACSRLGGEDGDDGDDVAAEDGVGVLLGTVRRGDAEQRVDAATEQPHRDAVRRLPHALVRHGGAAAAAGLVQGLDARDVLVGLDVEELEGLAVADLRGRGQA